MPERQDIDAAGPAAALSPTLQVLRRLAVKRDVTLGTMPRDEQLATLAFASRCIGSEVDHDERGVNVALKAWLADAGAMLRIDHVELRRGLVDAGFWVRDGYGRAYRRARTWPTAEAAAHAGALDGVDADALVRGWRDAHAAERARRRAAAASRGLGGPAASSPSA